MTKKYVYLFSEGKADMKYLLGGKGANLAEMTNIGLPVPTGLTITTEACVSYQANNQFPAGLDDELFGKLTEVENLTGKKFGDPDNPLLLSVRSGAAFSMPGMMDTILNLGLNDTTVEGMAKQNERFALDCYRRFITMFSDVVLGVEHAKFEEVLEAWKEKKNVKFDYDLDVEALRSIIAEFKAVVQNVTGKLFPQEPKDQLRLAVKAVFDSWNTPRAKVYRQLNKIPDDLGTAVNVQVMVFGNMGEDCGTGVAFTRNPSTGENKVYGEYLMNSQGEDVVAGIRTPNPIAQLGDQMPEIYQQFVDVCELLEKHYKDMQDVEFTIEKNKLYMLQTRNGKRTAAAAVKVAVDMFEEGLITKEEALLRVEPESLHQLLHRRLDPNAQVTVLATGLPASPGAGCGAICFDADEAEELGAAGKKVVLVRTETTPDDIHGIVPSQAVLTERGGMTSHAAVVARGMGKPAVCGCEAAKINFEAKTLTLGGKVLKEGEIITVDGATGRVILGEVPMIDPTLSGEFETLLNWANEYKKLGVRTNADNPTDAKRARDFGAEGVGLCRTEHMFMEQERLPIVQEMILSETLEAREAALAKLLSFQQNDFYGLLKAMESLPVTIRLLDPPLHEFLPNGEELALEIQEMKFKNAPAAQIEEKEYLLKEVRELHEFNPMLGHRGCRLGIVFPEIYAMQARAIFGAVAQLVKEGFTVIPEVEIPLVGHVNELSRMKKVVDDVAAAVKQETGVNFEYTVGTMVELPRACATADQIATEAEFFSFGTNDLTQTTFGFSRDDAEGKFLGHYVREKVLEDNPFAVLDRQGVGELMKLAIKLGRQTKPDLLIGICGEHGGEPSSVEFCHQIGLDFVSCSPFRVPVARLAAAQAVAREKLGSDYSQK